MMSTIPPARSRVREPIALAASLVLCFAVAALGAY